MVVKLFFARTLNKYFLIRSLHAHLWLPSSRYQMARMAAYTVPAAIAQMAT